MNDQESLQERATSIQQQVLADCEIAEDGALKGEVLTRLLLDYLEEFGEIEDPRVAHFESDGARCSGWALSEDKDRLDLFLTYPIHSGEAVAIPAQDLAGGFAQLKAFLEAALAGQHGRLEESTDACSMMRSIHEAREDLSHVRLFLLTNGLSKLKTGHPGQLPGIDITCHVWDLQRFDLSLRSGRDHEPIRVNFADFHPEPIRALMVEDTSAGYRSYMTILPGPLIVGMYRKFGPRLLERNVRSFLQLKGKVNKGIRETILQEPGMFLAFNNGLSVTATGIQVRPAGYGMVELVAAEDFQIVNGGQTTGSLYRAALKDKATLDRLNVAVKITEILPEADIEAIAPRVSEFANAQNKVNSADFSSNNAYLRSLELLSRRLLAPAGPGGGELMTYWFFERARGQYHDELSRAGTPGQRRNWEVQHPRRQLVTKTDLAKFEYSWRQLPHIVSRGAQKCYVHYVDRLETLSPTAPDEVFYRNMIARAILFKETDKLVAAHRFGGYKANITTYTVALLSVLTGRKLDFEAIWQRQGLDDTLARFISELAIHVQRDILEGAGTENVVQWCKEERAWLHIQTVRLQVPPSLAGQLLQDAPPSDLSDDEQRLIMEVALVDSAVWFEIAKWGKETKSLHFTMWGIADSLGNRKAKGQLPTVKMAIQGRKMLEMAERAGVGLRV